MSLSCSRDQRSRKHEKRILIISLHRNSTFFQDSNGESWCPDCVVAEPVVNQCMQKVKWIMQIMLAQMYTVQLQAPEDSHYLYVGVGDRATWKDPNCIFRTHKDTQLKRYWVLIILTYTNVSFLRFTTLKHCATSVCQLWSSGEHLRDCRYVSSFTKNAIRLRHSIIRRSSALTLAWWRWCSKTRKSIKPKLWYCEISLGFDFK